MLRRIRRAVAAALFVCVNLFFIGVGGGLGAFERFQLVPALFAMNVAALVVIAAMTLLFGRIYCSTLCPLGVFQDIAIRLTRKSAKKRFSYAPAQPLLRYAVLATAVAACSFGFAVVPALIDPYSLYGRIAAHLVQPVAYSASNMAAWATDTLAHPFIFKQEIFVRSMLAFSVAAASLIAIGFLAARWGRLFCNTVCPAGSLLAVLSHRPLFRIAIDGDTCVGCGLCAKACKALCIDAKAHTVDNGRCVCCFNCLETCPKGAIAFGTKAKTKIVQPQEPASSDPTSEKEKRMGRRTFVVGAVIAGAATTAVAVTRRGGKTAAPPEPPVMPPGAGGREHLLARCTSCNLCVAKCKGHVLRPAFLEYGLGGMMVPRLDFARGFCGWDCNACGTVCPNGAIMPLTIEEKRKTKIGRAVFIREHCVLVTDKVDACGNCAEHCPTKALTLVEENNTKKYPCVDESKCIGCGACEYHCPAVPRAIRVVTGNKV